MSFALTRHDRAQKMRLTTSRQPMNLDNKEYGVSYKTASSIIGQLVGIQKSRIVIVNTL